MKLLLTCALPACLLPVTAGVSLTAAGVSQSPIIIHEAWLSPRTQADSRSDRLNLYFSNRGGHVLRSITVGIRPPGRPTRKFRHAGALAPGKSVFVSRLIARLSPAVQAMPLRLVSVEYRRGRESFTIRNRASLRRSLNGTNSLRNRLIAGAKKSAATRLRVQPGPRRRLNFDRARAVCEFSGGRLPSLREARKLLARERGRLKTRFTRSVWTTTTFHDSGRAMWLFNARTGRTRGLLKHRRAAVVCVSKLGA